MSTVAFIGLGAMGSRMAANLIAAGFKLRVWNRDTAKTKPLADKGATVTKSVAEAVKGAEFVVSIVSDDIATREVMLGAGGVIGAAAPGTIVLDCSTNTPAMAREVAKAASARGVHYLDSPVLGSLPQAQGKELVILVGGDKAAFEKAQPAFNAMGRMARHIGGSGAGATLKLVNNMLSASLIAALGEAAQVIEAAKLDTKAAAEILGEGAVGCRVVKGKLPKMLARDFSAQFQLELMDKDVRYFLQLAGEVDRPTPIASLVRSQYQGARRADLGKLDSSAVFLYAANEKAR
jgi:3-hydroxyisobutyrate dehydrogenase